MAIFRELGPQDRPEMNRVWEGLSGHYGHPIGGEWTPEKIWQELSAGGGIGAFEDDGVLQAFCLYRKLPGVREITLLVTDARYHRTGAMRGLIRSLIEDLDKDEKVWLEVHAGNIPAISLYEGLGFHLVGERPRYYQDGGKALLYEYNPLQ